MLKHFKSICILYLIAILISACSEKHKNQSVINEPVDMRNICYAFHSRPYLNEDDIEVPNEVELKEVIEKTDADSNTELTSSENAWTLTLKSKNTEEQGPFGKFSRCVYLGTRDGWNIIYEISQDGGSFVGNCIFKCKEEKGNLLVFPLVEAGDSWDGGIENTPIYDGEDKVYFYRRLSIYHIASMSDIPEKEQTICQKSYDWGVAKYVYNFKTDKTEIISIDINYKNLDPELTRIFSFINVSDNQQIHISKQNIPAFLEKFKKSYLEFIKAKGIEIIH